MADLRFDGRVVVVTGAGAGLGRAYALLFGSRGAKVVVNDLGGGRHGDGKSSKAADDVVEEIKRNGGTAVADYNSVVDGEKIIQTALDKFGRIDVLVNNAGILRDKSFARISDQDWNLIHDVHLKGSFKTSQAAFPIFKKQNYGRVIMTSSNSGLYGNFGQANYSAAKMGLVGLSSTLSVEGRKNNIHSNVIVPTAASRLTEDILPPDVYAELKPELIAPVVAWLCHEACTETGAVIEAAAGWAGKCHIIRSDGRLMRKTPTDIVTPEDVRANWASITDMSRATHLDSIQEATGALMTSLAGLRGGDNEDMGIGGEIAEDQFMFKDKDLITYALGVGCSVAKPDQLRFLYENHEDFSPLPAYFVQPSLICLMGSSLSAKVLPDVALQQFLHGEQYFELIADEFPSPGTNIISRCKLTELLDKGSGALCVYDVESFDERGTLLFRNQIMSFAVGAGNFGGKRVGTAAIPTVPKPSRNPDCFLTHQTHLDQAALFRLSGDTNPLHIDPNISVLAGFKKPILHGMCTLGISIRLVMEAYASNDSSLFKALKVRFVKPVLPGQTLRVNMWRNGNRINFETIIVETNTTVITGAYVDLKSVNPSTPQLNKLSASMSLQSDAIFEVIVDRVKQEPQKAKAVNGIFLYNITKDGKQAKQWTMDLKEGKVYSGPPQGGKPNTTLTISDSDFIELATGRLNPQQAFMKGKLKVSGNIMMAQKLGPLLKAAESKL